MTDAYEWKEPRPARDKNRIPRSSHGHFVVQMVINDSDDDPGQITRCGSLAEYRTRTMVLAEPDTVDVVEQVALCWRDAKGETHNHYLDHLVVKADGRRIGLTDKPYKRVTEEFSDEIRRVRRDNHDVIDELYLVTEFARDPVKLFNADLIRGCRDADPEPDEEARIVVDEMVADATIRALVKLIGMGPRGLRALVRLIGAGDLVLLSNEKISHDALVRRAGGYLHD